MFQVLYRFIDTYKNAKYWDLPSGDDRFQWEGLLDDAKPVAKAFEKYLEHEAKTLDAAFGVKRPPNYHLAVARERLVKSDDVFTDCMRLYHAGATIDMPLFEAVAELHSLKASKVKEYFYYARKYRLRGNKLPERSMEPAGPRYATLEHYWNPGEGPFPAS